MAGKRTLCIIKPDALEKGYAAELLERAMKAGFRISGLRMTKLDEKGAKKFYEVHKGKPFYENLADYMTSGPIIAAALEREDAVKKFRKMLGNTDPDKAELGTLRRLYGESLERNAVHGSDSDENAEKEISFFFSKDELF